ncbi:DegQ family serine endoprotease [Pseudomarimonas arenosa]|uniref:DegQ family serine endoprotease n=1 Tax=Pseudomarimonas arenosa TaxID=2774145 RepID=A0AAW3ZKP0_9GAMM|nr:DegQ family serine endoprotease [Pseudomarimonas arenosa]MBD8525490.1 DegQ family serine endoprotease [Pseudomarimonas arenosa]
MSGLQSVLLRSVIALAWLLFGVCASAALPAEVDGQPLPSLAPMLERVTPAVVNIHSRTRVRVRNPLADDPFFRHFFGLPAMPQERVQQSLGSGVIVDAEQGLVLTNNHVVEGADDIQVTLADGRTLSAEFVGSDPDTDVALVRVPAERLSAVRWSDQHSLRVGDFVVAVGNPFGLGQTVTSGIVSALGRQGLSGLGYQNFIQTDASINPGNSGGALVNLRGELVGINTAIYSPSGGNVGIGFAIPIELAREVMRQLLAFGEVRRGSLGIQTQDIDAAMAQWLELKDRRGAVITRVQEDSPADRAGLKPGDVVVRLGDSVISDRQALHNAEGLLPVERPVQLEILREGQRQRLQVVVQAKASSLSGESLDARLAGSKLVELPERLRQRGVRGVRVDQVAEGSRAALNGLREGDLIVALNRREFEDLDALRKDLQRPPRQLLLTVVRGRGALLLLAE